MTDQEKEEFKPAYSDLDMFDYAIQILQKIAHQSRANNFTPGLISYAEIELIAKLINSGKIRTSQLNSVVIRLQQKEQEAKDKARELEEKVEELKEATSNKDIFQE